MESVLLSICLPGWLPVCPSPSLSPPSSWPTHLARESAPIYSHATQTPGPTSGRSLGAACCYYYYSYSANCPPHLLAGPERNSQSFSVFLFLSPLSSLSPWPLTRPAYRHTLGATLKWLINQVGQVECRQNSLACWPFCCHQSRVEEKRGEFLRAAANSLWDCGKLSKLPSK